MVLERTRRKESYCEKVQTEKKERMGHMIRHEGLLQLIIEGKNDVCVRPRLEYPRLTTRNTEPKIRRC